MRDGLRTSVALAIALASASAAQALVVHVPGDVSTLQAAIAQMANDGDVIELADGTYDAPASADDGQPGFRISNRNVDFTIRAAPGASVVLDGQNVRPVLRFQNSSLAQSGHVTFAGLEFRNGRSNTVGLTAGVTMQRAEATFRECRFENNNTLQSATGGGGVQVSMGSIASFEGSVWSGNSSPYYGGGLTVSGGAQVVIRDSQLLANRSNPPGHHPTSTGGGVHIVDSTVEIENTRFAGNSTSYGGGGLYALGTWSNGASVTLRNCTFDSNQAEPDPSVILSLPSEGGGVHVEDLVALRVYESRFYENSAHDGGGLNTYRGDVEVYDSIFRGNRSTGGAGDGTKSLGGQISVISNDVADASTNGGAINRRPARLVVEDSFFEGRYGDTGSPADVGGCLYANGDANRVFGLGGVDEDGTVEENRASVAVRRSVFADCDVVQNAVGGSGAGGAIYGDVVDLELVDSIVVRSDAVGLEEGDNASGGAVALASMSRFTASGTAFQLNSAGRFGGAVFAQGTEIDIADSDFVENEVSPGVSEGCPTSGGSALFAAPAEAGGGRPAQAATGLVSNSIFAENVGLPLFDDDRTNGPENDTHYDANRIHAPTFGGAVFTNAVPNDVPPFSVCITAAQMNDLVVQRANDTTTDKSHVENVDLPSPPARAALVAAPSRTRTVLAAGDPPSDGLTMLGFGFLGDVGELDGVPLLATAGVVQVPAGVHVLSVDDGAAEAQVTVAPEAEGAAIAAVLALAQIARLRSARS